jgi:hypothetical protein
MPPEHIPDEADLQGALGPSCKIAEDVAHQGPPGTPLSPLELREKSPGCGAPTPQCRSEQAGHLVGPPPIEPVDQTDEVDDGRVVCRAPRPGLDDAADIRMAEDDSELSGGPVLGRYPDVDRRPAEVVDLPQARRCGDQSVQHSGGGPVECRRLAVEQQGSGGPGDPVHGSGPGEDHPMVHPLPSAPLESPPHRPARQPRPAVRPRSKGPGGRGQLQFVRTGRPVHLARMPAQR